MKTQQALSFISVMRAIAIAIVFSAAAAGPVWGATLVVTNVNDSGAGSLRQALISANSSVSVPDTINFNIPGTGPFTITPLSALPTVTDPVVIDGYTQPGASANTLTNGDDAILKIVVSGTFGLVAVNTSNSVVRGLAIGAVNLGIMGSTASGSNVVEGNFIGLDATGTNAITGSALLTYIPNNRIGGTTPAARNVISGHQNTGGVEMLERGSGNTVQGNFIGTDRTGTKAIGNFSRAVVSGMDASNNIIGGTVAGARNVISGNLDRGITLDGSNNVVQGNYIGTDVTGLLPLGNARTGVEIGGTGNIVGGTNSGAGNIIAYNGINGGVNTTNGVDLRTSATGSTILGNSIFSNLGLGIDVKADYLVTPGFPVITLASNAITATVIKGSNTPSTTFRLELFANPTADPSGYGEGKTLLVSTDVTPDAGGNFTVTLLSPILPGVYITATGNGNTEFSQARLVIASGHTNSWTNSASGKWETGPNWSLGVPPFSGLSMVLITNAGTKTVNNDATTATGFPSTLTISNLVISAPGAATNTLLLAQGGTATPLHILSNLTINNGGSLVLNNAALSLDAPSGNNFSVDGTATLGDGQILANSSGNQILVGNTGTGALTVSNGDFEAYSLIVGANAGANGIWRIAGGTNFINTFLDMADNLTATGTVLMTAGQLSVPNTYVGLFGNGQLIVSNGIFQCFGQGDIASQPGAQGKFTAAGGTSTFSTMLISENLQATGSVLVAGTALVQVNGMVDNRGSITVAGGTFNILGEFDGSTTNNAILVTGGQLIATNNSSFLTHVTVSNGTFLARDVFLGRTDIGTFTVAGGQVVTLGSFNGFMVGSGGGTGTLSQVGGLINLTNTDLNIGGLFGGAIGFMTISNGITQARNVYVGGQGGGTGTVTIAGGTLIASNLAVNAASHLIFNQGLLQSRAGTMVSSPTFTVGDGTHIAEFNLLSGTNSFTAGLRIATNSLLTGSGAVAANVTNFGVISPGSSPGRIDINGNLVLSNSSYLHLEIGGYLQSTNYDFIRVTGNVTLGGKLTISLSNNFQTIMTNGASFTNLTAGTSILGVFTNVANGGPLTTTDGYARFTVVYSGNTLRLVGLTIVDTDDDGMPDWWEDLHGLNKNVNDAALDSDGDGASNLSEFLAGTQPDNSNSVFRIVSLQPVTNNLRITWTTVAGKSYRVQTTSPSVTGSFSNNFSDFSPLILAGGIGESTTNFLLGSVTNARARYYRVRLGP